MVQGTATCCYKGTSKQEEPTRKVPTHMATRAKGHKDTPHAHPPHKQKPNNKPPRTYEGDLANNTTQE